jgi:hypothetical protein
MPILYRRVCGVVNRIALFVDEDALAHALDGLTKDEIKLVEGAS